MLSNIISIVNLLQSFDANATKLFKQKLWESLNVNCETQFLSKILVYAQPHLSVDTIDQLLKDTNEVFNKAKYPLMKPKDYIAKLPVGVVEHFASFLTKKESVELGYINRNLYVISQQKSYIINRRSIADYDDNPGRNETGFVVDDDKLFKLCHMSCIGHSYSFPLYLTCVGTFEAKTIENIFKNARKKQIFYNLFSKLRGLKINAESYDIFPYIPVNILFSYKGNNGDNLEYLDLSLSFQEGMIWSTNLDKHRAECVTKFAHNYLTFGEESLKRFEMEHHVTFSEQFVKCQPRKIDCLFIDLDGKYDNDGLIISQQNTSDKDKLMGKMVVISDRFCCWTTIGVLHGSYRRIVIANGVLNVCNFVNFGRLFNIESIWIQYKGGIYIDSEEIKKKANSINGNVNENNVESYDLTTTVWDTSLNLNEDYVCPKLEKLTIDCELNDKSNLFQFVLKSKCNVLNNLNELSVIELSRGTIGNVSKIFNWLKKSLPNKNICNNLNTLSFEFYRDYSKRDHLAFSQSKHILNRCVRDKEELKYQIKHVVMKWTINNAEEANIYSMKFDDHDTKFTIDLLKKNDDCQRQTGKDIDCNWEEEEVLKANFRAKWTFDSIAAGHCSIIEWIQQKSLSLIAKQSATKKARFYPCQLQFTIRF